MRSLRSINEIFPHAARNGLSADDIQESASRFGVNKLTPLPRDPAWRKLLGKFDEPIILILLAASILKLVVDLFQVSAGAGLFSLFLTILVLGLRFIPRMVRWIPAILFLEAFGLVIASVLLDHPSYEGLAVMIAVALATGVAFLSEYRSDKEFETLNAQKDAIRSRVIREGQVRIVTLEDLVVGDLIVLEAGDEIPADGRPLTANQLSVDQALMTGESEPVLKIPAPETSEAEGASDETCLYRGTLVVAGTGRMLVTNVGDDTMLGQIARRLGGNDAQHNQQADRIQQKLTMGQETTPLQEKLTQLARWISQIGYTAAILIFLALLARGIIAGNLRWPGADEPFGRVLFANLQVILSYFVYMVIIIVVAVPEGLPMSVTVSLALAMRKMTRSNSLVRQLVACETIGSATVICTDKTGTLTRNQMTVERVEYDTTMLRLNVAVNVTAQESQNGDQKVFVGNTTERALLTWLKENHPDEMNHLHAKLPVRFQSVFSSARKRMTTVIERDGKLLVLVKGATENVLQDCTLNETRKREIDDSLHETARSAMRTLGFAHKELPLETTSDELKRAYDDGSLEQGLTFDGFVGIRDPIRDDVPDAIRECQRAGIAIIMITGDNPETARSIARDLGILNDQRNLVLTSSELQKLSDEELSDRLPRLGIIARAQPLDKLRLVELLQKAGHVVAMTGDGTNDAPSLRRADVGLAMGITGTEVAKEASKIVLLDDSFTTIARAVRWGRALYENIQKFVQFQLTINVSALTIALLGLFMGFRPPFTVLQLLWINVIMDTFAAIALCSEPPRKELMDLPPKRRNERILTRSMLITIGITSLFFVIVMLSLLLGMENQSWFAGTGDPSKEFSPLTTRQVTIFFTVYVLFQVWNQINCRSLNPKISGWSGLLKNPTFLGIAVLSLLGQILIVNFGGKIFHVEPLSLADWLIITLATSSVLIFAELVRRIRSRVTS